MLSEERQNAILTTVNEKKSVTVQELVKLLGISESTIRRDLNQLDREGKLIKVHGGAMTNQSGYYTLDDDVAVRKGLNRDEKLEIARYAAGLIEPGDIIYMDAGTTTELMIDFIPQLHATFVTNSFSHAKRLAERGLVTYILGGEFKPVTEAIVGEEAILCLDKYNFTKGFWGANGVTVKNGFSTPDVKEAMVKRKSMQKTRERFVLCDSSKFSQISSVSFADFESAGIITSKIEDTAFKGYKNILEVEK
ncbi:MAG: DeoR/GlpR family DNA-binding transcription regulator [Wujia sp.]